MEDTMLELVKICQEKEFLCIYDDIDDLIESSLDSKLLLINSNSQCLDKKEHEVKNVVEQPAEREKRKPEHLLSMGYEHLSITPEIESDKVTESNAENLLPILIYDYNFENIEYVEASLPDPEIVSIEEENGVEEENVVQQEKKRLILRIFLKFKMLFFSDNSLLDNFSLEFETFCDHSEETRSGNTTHADYSLLEYDSFCFEIEPDQERLNNLMKNDIPDDLSNDLLLEELDLFLSDNSIPLGIENIANDPEGDIHFLEELLIDDSILSYESFDSNFEDNPSIPRPPPEPPDAKTNAGEEIAVMMNGKDKFDDDYQFFMFDK
nr:hypothetical protein [Tanacetum cinerariifolium]